MPPGPAGGLGRAVPLVEDGRHRPPVVGEEPDAKQVALSLRLGVVGEGLARVHHGVVVEELHVAGLERDVDVQLLGDRVEQGKPLELGGRVGVLVEEAGHRVDVGGLVGDREMPVEEVEHRHRVPRLAARRHLVAAIAVQGLHQGLDEIGAPPQHLVVDRPTAHERALPAPLRGLKAEQPHDVAGVGVVLDALTGIGPPARGVAEGLAEVLHVVQEIAAPVLRHDLVAEVARDTPEHGGRLAPPEAGDGEAADLDEADPVDDPSAKAGEHRRESGQLEPLRIERREIDAGRLDRVRRGGELGDLVRNENVQPPAPLLQLGGRPHRGPGHRLHGNVRPPVCSPVHTLAHDCRHLPRAPFVICRVPGEGQRMEAMIRPRRSMLSITRLCSSPGHCIRMMKCRTPRASR